ncbi:hypothetical protein HW115_15745 [Verrucomicrobiaceae bacterium N1E253]|uniref:Uncharacterized protein n=1 Tax=Oceaniferula marina TaxID=2748318 RepID=A0A851GI95_9BACT|nr:hypothetical protein [Oceaniferula marina]NWK57076.1 hypothetical protein [Oceaniferula marina]
MKTTLLTTAMAALGLALSPLYATDGEASPETTAEAQAAETISTYVIQYSGGG